MKKLLAVALGLVLAASAARANPVTYIWADGGPLVSTSDYATIHINMVGNTAHEHIGILWFLITMDRRLRPYLPTPSDFRYESGVFWNVPPTDNSMDSLGVTPSNQAFYLFTLNSYQPADSCLTRAANDSGKIGTFRVRLRAAQTAYTSFEVRTGQIIGSLSNIFPNASSFPPSTPWTQLCFLQNGENQPGVDSNNMIVSIAGGDGGGGGGGCTRNCEGGLTAVKHSTWGQVKAIYR